MGTKTQDSRNTYNKIADNYDDSKEGKYTCFHISELTKIADLKRNDTVLDVGCGNGTLLNQLTKKEIINANGIDISENMIKNARFRYPDIHFKIAPSFPLEWPDNSIDVITVSCAFHHFEYPQAFAKECFRTLKKDGTVYLAEPNFGPVIRFFANNFYFHLTKSGDVKVFSMKQLKRIFEDAGFKDIKTYKKDKGIFLIAQTP